MSEYTELNSEHNKIPLQSGKQSIFRFYVIMTQQPETIPTPQCVITGVFHDKTQPDKRETPAMTSLIGVWLKKNSNSIENQCRFTLRILKSKFKTLFSKL